MIPFKISKKKVCLPSLYIFPGRRREERYKNDIIMLLLDKQLVKNLCFLIYEYTGEQMTCTLENDKFGTIIVEDSFDFFSGILQINMNIGVKFKNDFRKDEHIEYEGSKHHAEYRTVMELRMKHPELYICNFNQICAVTKNEDEILGITWILELLDINYTVYKHEFIYLHQL